MQGGIVCVMILEKEGRTGRVDVSTLPVLFIGLIIYIMAA